MSSPVRYTTKILQKKSLTPDVSELHIEKPEGFTHQCGQFVQFVVPDGEKKLLRSYSLSSTTDAPHLEFCIKFLENGKMAHHLGQLNEGDSIEWQGPLGRFTNSNKEKKLFFIATGVGLAPIMGILEDELKNKKNPNKMHLLFGVRERKDIFWHERLKALADAHHNFHFSLMLSQPDAEWTGAHGRVTEAFPKEDMNWQYFLCGNPAMVQDSRKLLIERGVPAAGIHMEIF